jgi:hypothetical protein
MICYTLRKKYGALAIYETIIPSQAGLLHEIHSEVHKCPGKQVNNAQTYQELLSQQ